MTTKLSLGETFLLGFSHKRKYHARVKKLVSGKVSGLKQGTLTEGEGSVQLTSTY